jgi:hypothetical protein
VVKAALAEVGLLQPRLTQLDRVRDIGDYSGGRKPGEFNH